MTVKLSPTIKKTHPRVNFSYLEYKICDEFRKYGFTDDEVAKLIGRPKTSVTTIFKSEGRDGKKINANYNEIPSIYDIKKDERRKVLDMFSLLFKGKLGINSINTTDKYDMSYIRGSIFKYIGLQPAVVMKMINEKEIMYINGEKKPIINIDNGKELIKKGQTYLITYINDNKKEIEQ